MSKAERKFPHRYTILGALGGGGGGSVYKVLDSHLNSEIALKSIGQSCDGTADEEAFKSEFLLSASVSHPNLVTVHDFGYDDANYPFFTMELVKGEEISSDSLFRSEDTFLRLLGQICSALGLLHHFGYFHNDLKPANIRIESDGPQPLVKILDLGLTREYDPSRARELGGTVEYMAPEIFQSSAPSKLSDIYSLGIVLYQLVTGNVPFSYSDPLSVISGHVEQELPPIESMISFHGEECAAVLRKMLEKDPSNRPSSTAEVLERFASALNRNPEEYADQSILPYFDTAILQHIKRSPQFLEVTERHKKGVRLGCTDSRLADLAHRLVKQTLQTRFVNVTLEHNIVSGTTIHSADTVDLMRLMDHQGDSSALPESFVADLGNYGLIDSKLATIPRLESDSVIAAALDRVMSDDQGRESASEKIAEMCAGNLTISHSVLADLCNRRALVRVQGGFKANDKELANHQYDQQMIDELLKQIEFLSDTSFDALSCLSIFDRQFTCPMASAALRLPDHQTAPLLTEITDARILKRFDDTFRFRHEPLRQKLYDNLEPQRKEESHIAVAEFLADSAQLEDSDQIAALSKHNALGGNIREGIRHAIEYQRLLAAKGEFTEPESLLMLCDRIYRAGNLRDDKLESGLLISIGNLYKLQGKFDLAIERYDGITELPDVEPRLLAETYKDLGDIYKSRVEFSKGLEALKSALKIYREIGDQLEISHTMNNMGNIYWINSEYDLALRQYEDALKIQEELGATKDVASTLSNMGVAYFVTGSHGSAIKCFERSIELKKEIDDQPGLARTYNNLAAAYQEMGEFGRALNYLNQSVAINRETGAQKELMINLENIAEVCMGLGKYERAEEVSVEGLEMARRQEDVPHQGVFSSLLGYLYTERSVYGKALETLHKSMEVAESITDKPFMVKVLLLLAKNYILMNALDLAAEMLEKAKRTVSPIERNSQLLKLRIMGAHLDFLRGKTPPEVLETLDRIDEEAEKSQFKPELCESLLLRFEILAQHASIPAELLERFDRLTEGEQYTVFRSFQHFYLGISAVHDRSYEDAVKCFQRAQVMAEAFGRKELLWRANFRIGMVRMAQLEYEEAFLKLKLAGTILKEIAQGIGDGKLMRSYMGDREKLELIEAVRQLTVKLA